MSWCDKLMGLCVCRASWCAKEWTTRATCVTGVIAVGNPSVAATIMNCGVSSSSHNCFMALSFRATYVWWWQPYMFHNLIGEPLHVIGATGCVLTGVYFQGSGWCGLSSLSWYAAAFASTGALSSASSSSAGRMRSTSLPTERLTTTLTCPFISVSI